MSTSRPGSLLRRPFEYRQYNISIILIAANVLVFLLNYMAPETRIEMSLVSPAVPVEYAHTAFWQLLTYMFVHAGFSHIFFNMLGLFFFGIQVERRVGSSEFLLFYLVTGVGAGLVSLLIFWLTGTPTILLGASGAVFGVLLAFATFFPTAMIYVFGIIPVRAPLLVLVYTGIELFSQLTGARSGVAHLTHLAGFAVAYLYLIVRFGLNPIRVFLGSRR
ncbi:MAG TPA: rhomboid family intramembrane serine protease [Spirochaetia bacterium]|nr:rhomboid family intramembrane serine protease [Spirochaetia bacterium]